MKNRGYYYHVDGKLGNLQSTIILLVEYFNAFKPTMLSKINFNIIQNVGPVNWHEY